jgi:hypothetical protein
VVALREERFNASLLRFSSLGAHTVNLLHLI